MFTEKIRGKKAFVLAAILAFSFVPLFAVSPATQAQDVAFEDKKLLFLSSSNFTDSYYQKQINCLQKTLPINYKVYCQYVGSNFEFDQKDYEAFEEFYKAYMEKSDIDFLVTADLPALRFVQAKRDLFFKGLPVVVLGFKRGADYDSAFEMDGIQVVFDDPFVEENIKLINSLFPRRRKIAFIDCRETNKALIDSIKSKFDIQAEYKNIDGMSKEQIAEYARSLDKCSILFMPSAYDLNGSDVTSEDVVKVLSANSENPIFTCHDVCFGQGVLGGYFVSVETICDAISGVLRNYSIYRSVVNTYGTSRPLEPEYFFDVQQMKKFNIVKSSLNTRTVYINDDQSFVKNRNFLIALLIVAFLVLPAIAIIVFCWRAK